MVIGTHKIKVALVHDWITEVGGAEKVLKEFYNIFSGADIFCIYHDQKFTKNFLPNARIRTSYIQKIPKIFRKNALLAPFMPMAVESFDLSSYDLVISTASFSKGLVLKPRTIHVNYCSSPTRQIWDWHIEYKSESSRLPKTFTSLYQHFARIWDRHASSRVDYFIANSYNIKNRIKKYYQADSTVIYPPVDLSMANSSTSQPEVIEDYFLIVSRLFKNKSVELAVSAFIKLDLPLIVIGDGPELLKLKKIVKKNRKIKLLGFQPDKVLKNYFRNCKAFVMPQEEDFGIAPIEALSFGKPVLALRRGGALEYIEEGVNGEFFDDPVSEVLADGVRRLNQNYKKYNPERIRQSASRFSRENFRKEIISFLNEVLRKKGNINLFN